MQHTPVVPVPKQQRGRNWYPIIGALALIAIVILIAYAIANPVAEVQAPAVPVNLAANPELVVFEQYQQLHAAAIETARWHQSPEVATFHNYRALNPLPVELHENPEVGAFLRWQEGQ